MSLEVIGIATIQHFLLVRGGM